MNAVLYDMIAARVAAQGNPAVAEALARMRSNPGGDPNQMFQDLVAQLGNANPAMATLAKQFAEANANSPAKQKIINVEPVAVEEVSMREDATAESATEELRAHVTSMFAELTDLRERIDLLASALGACCLCWGEDNQCRVCRGRGRPGFSIPDEALFAELVLPAIGIMRTHKAKGRPVSPTLEQRKS